jgi:hypothetical protein
MTHRDRDALDELSEELFAAARQERPSPALRDNLTRAMSQRVQVADSAAANLSATSPSTSTRGVSARDESGAIQPANAWFANARAWLLGASFVLSAAAVLIVVSADSSKPSTTPRIAITPDARDTRSRPAALASTPQNESKDLTSHTGAKETGTIEAQAAVREKSPAPRPSAAPSASLAQELSVLERARVALAGSEPLDALRALDEYEKVLRGSQLRAEATLLRVETLSKLGRGREARELASTFDARFPGSPLSDRARAFARPIPETTD